MSILHFSGFSGHEETVIMLLFCQVTVIGSFFFKYGTLHEFAYHPCAGAMLIFSVSFQF